LRNGPGPRPSSRSAPRGGGSAAALRYTDMALSTSLSWRRPPGLGPDDQESKGAARATDPATHGRRQLVNEEENLIIELQRQWIENDPLYIDPSGETTCSVCSHVFEEPSVVAIAHTDNRHDMGVACMGCVAYLGRRSPGKFPTLEEYRRLLEQYPRPMYESEEALIAAGEAAGYEDPSEIAYEPSWVWRRPREDASA
jgi:hypothetical protein